MKSLTKGASIFLMIGLFLTVSCGPKEYKKIPLESLDPKLKKTGSLIVKDILTSITHEDGARYLLNKAYMTPLVHGRIMRYMDMYNGAYAMIPMTIGKVSTYSLFQVVDKGIIKTMRYKLVTDTDDMKFIELKIDVNIEYGLADYYLYLTSKDGFLQRENVLPKAIK
ncbi:MAG: hypothetical protein ABFR05_12145 [Bacteroidota bacterium]